MNNTLAMRLRILALPRAQRRPATCIKCKTNYWYYHSREEHGLNSTLPLSARFCKICSAKPQTIKDDPDSATSYWILVPRDIA